MTFEEHLQLHQRFSEEIKPYLSQPDSSVLHLSSDNIEALMEGCIKPEIHVIENLVILQKQLNDQKNKLSNYIAAQEAKQAQDDAQRLLDLKKQRRHEWYIAFFSAAVGAVFSFLVDRIPEILLFFQ